MRYIWKLNRSERFLVVFFTLQFARGLIFWSFVLCCQQWQKNPSRKHLHMLHNVLRYLSKYPSYSICLGQKPDKPLQVYTDASWAADVDDRHSMSGGFLMLAGAPIDQLCVTQPVLARSVFEAELLSIWLHTSFCSCQEYSRILRLSCGLNYWPL